MTNLAGMFLRMATSGKPAESHRPPEPKSRVVLQLCKGKCGMQSPHIHKPGYLECVWCLNRVPNGRTETAS